MSTILRDYLYLDENRVRDYLSSLGPGFVEEFRETIKEASGGEGEAGLRAHFLNIGGKRTSQEESMYEATYRIGVQNSFHRIYEQLEQKGAIKVFDEETPLSLDGLRRGEVIELTRNFTPSPLNAMIDRVFELLDLMKQLGLAEQLQDQESQQAIGFMTMIFRDDQEEPEVPMLVRGDGREPSVIFTARASHMLKTEEAFEGELTVFGKVQRKLPSPKPLDLFDLLRLPSALRGNESRIRELILELFESWPPELGGPPDKEAMVVPGPVLIVTPVAVYT